MGYRLQDGGQIDVGFVCNSFIYSAVYHNLAENTAHKTGKRNQLYERKD